MNGFIKTQISTFDVYFNMIQFNNEFCKILIITYHLAYELHFYSLIWSNIIMQFIYKEMVQSTKD